MRTALTLLLLLVTTSATRAGRHRHTGATYIRSLKVDVLAVQEVNETAGGSSAEAATGH